MCTTAQNYDYCGVYGAQTEESSEGSGSPAVCTHILIAPSLNAILKGTLSPIDNIVDVENAIWYPDTPETFLQASLQFLENKLHSRIFQMSPTSSGKIILSDGFIFSPVYPTTPQDSQTTWDECVTKVHNFSEDDGTYAWSDPKRVTSVVYSCISIPGEHGTKSRRKLHASKLGTHNDVAWESQRDIGIQTSNEMLSPTTEMSSSIVSDEETQPISNFSEYVQYCHSIVKPPSQLFNFGKSTQKQMSDYETTETVTELKYNSTAEYPFQPTRINTDSLPNSARTYASHYRPSPRNQERDPDIRDKIPPYEASVIRRSPGPSSKITTSTTTVSSAKSFVSNRTEHGVYGKHNAEVASSTGSTKSVYYYARISASFFSFLNRATQKNNKLRSNYKTSALPNVNSATTSAVSMSKQKLDRTSGTEDEKDGKLTNAKLNVLRRFMNFFGGAKASKEYEKVRDSSAAIIDVKTGFFDNDNIFERELKPHPTENNESKIRCKSFSVPGKHSSISEWSANVVASERHVEKEPNLFSKLNRKAQTKSKITRHSQRDRDSDQYSFRTSTVKEYPNQQQFLESTQTKLVKDPSGFVSSIFGSQQSYSKTVCKDILKLRFEGDPTPITATDTSHDETDCCICYKPPKCYRNNDALPNATLDYFQDECNETVINAPNNDYICYSRIPENQRINESSHQHQHPPKEHLQQTSILRNFFKSRNDKKIYSTCSTRGTVEQIPKLPTQGKIVVIPKSPTHNQYRPKPQEYDNQKENHQSMQVPIVIEKPIMYSSTTNSPVVRKQNAYLIEKPQVNPDRITRLLPDDQPKVWTGGMRRECFPPSTDNNYNGSSDVNSSVSATSNMIECTDVNSSYSAMPTIITNHITQMSGVNTSLSTMQNHFSGNKDFQKYKPTSVEITTQNTASTSSSDFDCPTSFINNTVSNSSRSSYWLPPKRVARDNRDFPKLNPSKTFQVKPTFSKEVIKLFQRAPKSFRK